MPSAFWNLLSLLVFLGPVVASTGRAAAQEAPHSLSDEALSQAVILNYADLVFANYQDTYTAALDLQAAILAFLDEPSEASFAAAKAAWLAAREPFGQSEAYRFYGGPIDGPQAFAIINTWPMDEAQTDYVQGQPYSGFINNLAQYPEITPDLLAEFSATGSNASIGLGYHAIEFLLWGQDINPYGPGQRAYTDYTTAPNAERRAEYLRFLSDLLLSQLDSLVQAWNPDQAGNYREEFLALPPEQALTNILKGIAMLSKAELAGQKLFVAYDNPDQEDEESCFSDNTHRDIWANMQGILNVYLGQYTRLDGSRLQGPGLSALLVRYDPSLNQAILDQFAQTQGLLAVIPTPFDQAVINEESRNQVLEAVFALHDQADLLAQAAQALGLGEEALFSS